MGRAAISGDPSFIYNVCKIGIIEKKGPFQEANFHPLEVTIRGNHIPRC